jgi:DNA-binding MarR family transcriptional regulator
VDAEKPEPERESEPELKSESDSGPEFQLLHLLRGITVQFDLFGAQFAGRNGLHPTDVRALIQLLDADRAGSAATPGWLGRRLGLNSAAVTALIDRLQHLGLIRRTRDTRDRRRVLLSVEPAAVALGWSFFGPLIERMIVGMRTFDEAELATVKRFLVEMDAAVADVRNSPVVGAPTSQPDF